MDQRYPEESHGGLAEQSYEAVANHPMPSVLVAFGMGFGLGVTLALSMATGRSQQSSTLAQRLGHQMLDAMQSAVPDGLSKRWG